MYNAHAYGFKLYSFKKEKQCKYMHLFYDSYNMETYIPIFNNM